MVENIHEKRRFARLKSLYLISYVNKEKGVQRCGISMARTLDISPAGVRVEVYQQVNPDSIMEMEIAIEETIFSQRGIVIHSEQTANGNYIIGIEFDKIKPELASELS